MSSCLKGEAPVEDQDYIKSILQSSPWVVDLYFDGDETTDQFSDYVLEFSPDGMLNILPSAYRGTWNLTDKYNGGVVLEINIDGDETIHHLTDIWDVVEFREDYIRFEDRGGGPGEINQINRLAIKKV